MLDPFEIRDSIGSKKTARQLDWDESAFDTQTHVEGFFDENRVQPGLKRLQLAMLVCFGILAVRLFSLQVTQGVQFGSLAESNRLRNQTVLAPRGLIKDRYGSMLAQNTASFSLVVTPVDLPKQGLPEEMRQLAALLHIDEIDITEKVRLVNHSSIEPVLLKQDIAQRDALLFETSAAEFTGFSIRTIPVRDYIEPNMFSHVLGYAGVISEKEFQNVAADHYDPNDFIGKQGIELAYEKYLRGIDGQNQIEVDAYGRPVKVLGTVDPTPGNIAVMNIDKELQEKLYENFRNNSPNVRGAAVAINPKNGQILALLSLPGFNNNLFAHGISAPDYQALLDNKQLPLFNRVISGTYPPGSTVKPMVASAALEERSVTENTIVVDKGLLVIPNQFDPKTQYNFYGWKRSGLGPVNVTKAIALSSDIYFYTVAGGHPSSKVVGLGAEKLSAYYKKFGLGSPTGIDLQGEKSGIVANPEWKAEYFKGDKILSKWYLGDTYHIGIGQGDMLVTPLQVALWTATIANNGLGYKPMLLNKIVDQAGKTVYEPKPEVAVNPAISDRNMKIVQQGMHETVLYGSGHALATLPISAAGKTGTSQFDGSDPSRTHAWFTAYAPFEDPEIVITVLVEAGGEGHIAAVPIVKNVLQWWAENRLGK